MGLYEEGFTQNRELSWLTYNERVLEEALDNSVPLFERLNYIAIFVSNLEEFIQVRVGGLIGEDIEGDDEVDEKSGMTAGEQLDAVYAEIRRLLIKKDKIQDIVEEELEKFGLVRVIRDKLAHEDIKRIDEYYQTVVRKRITSCLVRKPKDFPYLNQDKPYIVCRLNEEVYDLYGVVDIPEDLPKILVLDEGMPEVGSYGYKNLLSSGKARRPFRYVLVEDIIKMNISDIFSPFIAGETFTFDIARNAEIPMGNHGDLLEEMKELSKKRRYSSPDKLIVDGFMSDGMSEYMMDLFNLNSEQLLTTEMIDYKFVGELADCLPEWLREIICFEKWKPFNQLKLGYGSVIDRLKRREILCCYPYDSMDPLLELLRESATDPRVREIRMTIYRLSSHPKIVEYLEHAAHNGKRVSVVMELRARFDEEHNIDWAEEMHSHGIKVNYGYEKYKIHSKLAQIVLREDGKTRYITHLSTGNFNEKTASKYTDIALITYDQRIGAEADKMWEDIMKSRTGWYDHILTSPESMKPVITDYIRREARKGEKGRIFIKVNSVTDEELIEELMLASCAGCKIRMIVRGICCILPGIRNATENIEIVNVIGRYLEHSRVYMFGEGKDEVMYISSADFMTRNMSKRVELACPIYNPELRDRIKRIMFINYADNVKGRILGSDGKYHRKSAGNRLIDSQLELMESAGKL